MKIRCPRCGAEGDVAGSTASLNDNENLMNLAAPDGFRKVVPGWRSAVLYLFCVKCGVAAEVVPDRGGPDER